MKKILNFVGHYDYLLSHMLLSENENSDYIVLQTKNAEKVCNFLAEKTSTECGRFQLIQDELFLGIPSERLTIEAIRQKYEAILRQEFYSNISDYDHVYMSFDEWNSFGIYLATVENLPPVSVICKYEDQLNADIYHFLSMPQMVNFSALQRKYRVLNAEAPGITEIIVLREGFQPGVVKGKKAVPFDTCKALKALSIDRQNTIKDFFRFDASVIPAVRSFLLVGDSYWFQSENSEVDEYLEMYQTTVAFYNDMQLPVVFKEHPRYALSERERDLLCQGRTIPSYVPIELLSLVRADFMACSVGNLVPSGIVNNRSNVTWVDPKFISNWKTLQQLLAISAFAQGNGYRDIYFSGCTDFLQNVWKQYKHKGKKIDIHPIKNHLRKELIFLSGLEELDSIDIANVLKRGNFVGVLNIDGKNALYEKATALQLTGMMLQLNYRKLAKAVNGSAYNPYVKQIYGFADTRRVFRNLDSQKTSYRLEENGWELAVSAEIFTPVRADAAYPDNLLKRQILNCMDGRRFIIYGGGHLAAKFARKYGETLDIHFVMVDEEEEVAPELLQKYQIVQRNRYAIGDKDYVIICKSFIHNIDELPEYALARDNFIREGYHPGEHFLYYKLYEALAEKKPIMLFCGYCELGGVKQVLDLTSAVNDYCMLFYHIGRETMEMAPGYRDFIFTVKICDILMHAPVIVQRGVMDENILDMISKNTRTIFVPQLSFRGYAPYKSTRFTLRNGRIAINDTVMYPFLYQIPFVNDMIIAGKTNREILQEIKREDLFSEEEIQANLKRALRMMQVMDARADISICDFVEENYQNELLFKDCIHANDILFYEYARRLSLYLQKPGYVEEIDCVERKAKEEGAYFQVASEEPILPCVAKALGLKFVDSKRLYMEKITEERIRMKKFDDWYRDYCNYYRSVLCVKNTLDKDYQTKEVRILREEYEE